MKNAIQECFIAMLMGLAAYVNAENNADDGWCECCCHYSECAQNMFNDENSTDDQGSPVMEQQQPQTSEDHKNTIDNPVALSDNEGVDAENASVGGNR